MNYDIEISDRAYADLEQQIDFLSRKSRLSAKRWYQRLRTTLLTLRRFPARCPVAPESDDCDGIVRHLFHGKRPHIYRILFDVRGKTVYILRIIHGKQARLKREEVGDE